MNMIEVIGVLFSLISVYYTTNSNKIAWYSGIVGIIFYMIFFYQNNLYANMILQLVFIGQSIWGLYKWERVKSIKRISKGEYIFALTSSLAIAAPIMILLNNTNSTNILFDSLTTSFSVVAMWLTAKRIVEAWVIWIIADIAFVIMFLIGGHYLSAITYFIFLLLAIKGFINWNSKVGKKL